MTKLWGVLALRLANADLLPFDFASYASNIRQFVNELEKNNKAMWGQDKNEGGQDKALWGQPPPLDLKPILDAIDDFEAAGKRLDESAAHALASGAIYPKLAATINHGTMQIERHGVNPDGVPRHHRSKHSRYGARFPYSPRELPGLTKAGEKQDWQTARQ